MLKQEFESMAMADGEHISTMFYKETVEYYYLRSDETKQEFINNNFGHNNTARSIIAKMWKKSKNENRKALRGNESATPAKLRGMDRMIMTQYKELNEWKLRGEA